LDGAGYRRLQGPERPRDALQSRPLRGALDKEPRRDMLKLAEMREITPSVGFIRTRSGDACGLPRGEQGKIVAGTTSKTSVLFYRAACRYK
jgi:hypothetical protein